MRNRDMTPDLMKIFACIAVIIIHVTATPASKLPVGSIEHLVAIFFNAATLFAVPCFIILSGYALSLGYHNKAIEYFSFVKRRCQVVLIPYLIWALSYYTLYVLTGMKTFSLDGFAIAIFLGKANYHLYFVPIILQLYVLYPLLKKMVSKVHPIVGILVLIAIHIGYSKWIPSFPFRDRLFMSYLLFFVSGMYMGIYHTQFKAFLKKYSILFMTLYVVGLMAYVNAKYHWYVFHNGKFLGFFQLWQLFSFTSFCGLYLLCDTLASKLAAHQNTTILTSLYNELSGATFYVYLMHPMVILFLKKIYLHIGFNSVFAIMCLNAVLVTLISFAIALAYGRYQKTRSLKAS